MHLRARASVCETDQAETPETLDCGAGGACRLLRERAPALNCLPRRWLDELLARTAAPGQSRDHILRRSAGLPAALVALFLAEPGNQARKVPGLKRK